MTDYISRQAAFEALEKRGVSTTNISRVPVADVRENVMGEWETSRGERLKTDGQHWLDCRCTVCGLYSGQASDFCPNCGADMRGDNK